MAPWMLRPAPLHGSFLPGPLSAFGEQNSDLSLSDFRLRPRYPAQSPLEDLLRLVDPGSDEYATEKYASQIAAILRQWSAKLKSSPPDFSAIAMSLSRGFAGNLLGPVTEVKVRTGAGIQVVRRQFSPEVSTGREPFIAAMRTWLGNVDAVQTAEFEITSIKQAGESPLTVALTIRYNLVLNRSQSHREERIGEWQTVWSGGGAAELWRVERWEAKEEESSTARGPMFVDVTAAALGGTDSYKQQMSHGSDYWRTVMDGASGIDVYGNNGVAAGDFDNDGFDDLYICQPAGLPNRLYRNRGDGTFEDVTMKAGVGVLDNSSCALFADFRDSGLQDLLVVCGSGPLLFLNQGNGSFAIKREAFKFSAPPQGTFTHAALADYDRDGKLDIYFCLYSYYLGLDQYHYPVPYYDARNGPPNFLLRNEGDGNFVDVTEASGLGAENNRYSFACAWGESGTSGFPDLYVANDFGRNNLYRNNGNGTFSAISEASHIQDVGAGMSASWADVDQDGRQDIYVSNMWSAAGQRVSEQSIFHQHSSESVRELYKRHARGNALYRNEGQGRFRNITENARVEAGRWAWSSDFWDFDHDGFPDLYVTNGYVSAPRKDDSPKTEANVDLGSFFWRQVVAKSPDDSTPTPSYERGWQALNELIRSDHSWSGSERNVMFANNRDGTFSEVSGVAGLDFLEDSRTFVLADIDHDGILEIILKNRNAPQLRVLHNSMNEIGRSVVFRLKGTHSNRDAIGASVTVERGNEQRETRYLQAGSGFLAQHSKELFFGVGDASGFVRATVLWPSGLKQEFLQVPVDHRISIEEGSPEFMAKPFEKATAFQGKEPQAGETLPRAIETWLIEPLKTPDFSLPDVDGRLQKLSQFEGKPFILCFWTVTQPDSKRQLNLLRAASGNGLEVIALHANPDDEKEARLFARQEAYTFPVLFATEETAGIYNIIYRYLFDRRRDIGFPTSFLIDREGMLVKLYQGAVEAATLIRDIHKMPADTIERVRMALPLGGEMYKAEFSRNEFTYGVAMFQHGYLDQAAESFRQVVRRKPNDAEAHYNLGTLSLRRNDFTQAKAYLEQALKLRPEYPEAWNNLGMMAAQQGQPDEAIAAFKRAIEQRPDYAVAMLNIGNVYRRKADMQDAAISLQEAFRLQPEDPEINYSLGMFYAQQGDTRQAAQYLQSSIELRPDYPEAINNLGVLFVRQQEYVKAQEQFERCIRIHPDFDQSYLNLSRLYLLQNDRTKARASLEQLIKMKPNNTAAAQALAAMETEQ